MKQFLTILLTMIVLVSCKENNQNNSTGAANEKLINQFFEHFNKHEWAKMAEMYAETADFKDPSLGTGIVKQTRQQTIDKYSELSKVFADLNDKIEHIYPAGDKHIIVEFISSGTAPDNMKFELPICTIFTIENGKITKDFTYYDNFEEEEESEQ
jgi:ketosteroid isomerase-like protein